MYKSITFLILFFITVTKNFASHETIIQVVQPVVLEEGIDKIIYTYIYYANYISDLRVKLTCEENYIKTDKGVMNRNIANIFNLKINFSGLPVFGDTLKAELLLPKEESIPSKYNITFEEVINATIECMIKNTASDRGLNYLDLKVIGDLKYINFSKVYKLRN